ncbi:MAG: hypothetical protein H6686_03505 [Fibrobacteria bacterium]|nr:hypothetical protein [Fibrobacteria bacterium]
MSRHRAKRGWFSIDLPPDWPASSPDSWVSPWGGVLEVREVLHSSSSIDADSLVELHENWCRSRHLHSHETRIEQLPSEILMVRSYGETRQDEFLMVGHFCWGGHLVRLSFHTGLGGLRDEELAEVLAVFFELIPSETHL